MAFPPWPGPGHHPLTFATPGFYLLILLLFTFGAMLWLLNHHHPGRKRGLDGFLQAAAIDLAFLAFGLVLVMALVLGDSPGNRTAAALYEVVVGGYWFTFSIPIVTVGTSIEERSRGSIGWRLPSILVSGGLFGVLFVYYYAIS